MPARVGSVQRFLLAFLLSLLAVMLAGGLLAVFGSGGMASAAEAVAAPSISLGLVWVILGWILSPSVETYLGPGGSRGMPIIGATFAHPERSPPVMTDLAWKLSGQTSFGIVSAALGFGFMLVGFAFYLAPVAGFAGGLLYLAVMTAVVLRVRRPAGSPASG